MHRTGRVKTYLGSETYPTRVYYDGKNSISDLFKDNYCGFVRSKTLAKSKDVKSKTGILEIFKRLLTHKIKKRPFTRENLELQNKKLEISYGTTL